MLLTKRSSRIVKFILFVTIILSLTAEFTLSATPAMAQSEATPLSIFVTSEDSDVIVTKRSSAAICHNQVIGPDGVTPLYTTRENVPDGTTFNLGRFPAGTELIFKMIGDPEAYYGYCNGTYYTGPGHRNPDGLVHAKIDVIGPETLLVGFEDVNGMLAPPDFNDFNYIDALFEVSGVSVTAKNNEGGSAIYRVTIKNVTQGQPFLSVLAATHRPSVTMFKPDAPASAELEMIAESGSPGPMAFLLSNNLDVTDVIGGGYLSEFLPFLMPSGYYTPRGGTTDIVTFEITANPDDRLSIVAMLACSNDGFAGLNRQPLPDKGARMFEMDAYDAGTEANTELEADLVSACNLGPVDINGGNTGIDSGTETPNDRVRKHPGIKKVGDLTDIHDFEQPVAFVIIERIK